MRWLDSITKSVDMNLSKLQEEPGVLQSTGLQRAGNDLATEPPPPMQFSIYTTLFLKCYTASKHCSGHFAEQYRN